MHTWKVLIIPNALFWDITLLYADQSIKIIKLVRSKQIQYSRSLLHHLVNTTSLLEKKVHVPVFSYCKNSWVWMAGNGWKWLWVATINNKKFVVYTECWQAGTKSWRALLRLTASSLVKVCVHTETHGKYKLSNLCILTNVSPTKITILSSKAVFELQWIISINHQKNSMQLLSF